MTSPRSSTCSRRVAGPAGRWIHFGLTSSDVLDTALALQLRRAGEVIVPGARERWRRRWPSRRARTRTRCVSAAPTACTPSRPRSGSSSPASRWRRTATPSGSSARSRRRRPVRDLRRGRHLRLAGPGVRGSRAGAAGAGRRAGLHPGRAARPPRRAAERDRAGRRRAGALRPGDPPPAAHRGARGRGAVPGGPEGLERDAAQAQPDHHRADLRPRARAARLRADGAGERRALARARHLALGRRAGRPAGRDDPARLHAAPGAARRARHGRPRRPHGARTSRSPAARCSRSGSCSLWSRKACSATTRTGSSSGSPSRRGTRGTPLRDLLEHEPGVELDLDAVFDYGHYITPRA